MKRIEKRSASSDGAFEIKNQFFWEYSMHVADDCL